MTELAIATCALGGLKIAGCLGSLYAPDQARRALNGFSRNEISGWVLTAICLFWSGWLILHTTPFSGVPRIEPLVYVGTPLAFFLLVIFMDELLAPRAAGGLLLLVACPILEGARQHESSLSLVMTLVMYVIVVFGMVLVVSPYRLRQLLAYLTHDRSRFRRSNFMGLVVGALLVTLGLTAY
jgi:hypothetical protein